MASWKSTLRRRHRSISSSTTVRIQRTDLSVVENLVGGGYGVGTPAAWTVEGELEVIVVVAVEVELLLLVSEFLDDSGGDCGEVYGGGKAVETRRIGGVRE